MFVFEMGCPSRITHNVICSPQNLACIVAFNVIHQGAQSEVTTNEPALDLAYLRCIDWSVPIVGFSFAAALLAAGPTLQLQVLFHRNWREEREKCNGSSLSEAGEHIIPFSLTQFRSFTLLYRLA